MQFDAIIIGSGQAGTPLAFKLASAGQQVAFIEKQHYGGTCVNVGCTPTKAYVASARRMYDATHGEALGVNIPAGAKVDLKKVKARKAEIVAGSADGIRDGLADQEKVSTFWGEAHFTGPKEVSVNGKTLTAPQVFINVGGRPRVPESFASVDYLTNESILQLETVPEHLLVIGGSYIGLEFGQMFRRFGSRVTIIEKGDRLVRREDPETSQAILEILQNEGVDVRLNAECLDGARQADGQIEVNIQCEDGDPTARGSHLLLAVGRAANNDRLNLSATGLSVDERGFIPVNDRLETEVKGIYALGDCNGRGAFTHTAYNDYEILVDHLFAHGDRKVSDRILNYGLYIDPPLGRAGMTLTEARQTGRKLLVGHRPMSKVARAKEKGETQGFMSVVVDAETERILGATILGVGGDEIISSLLNVMYADQPYTVIRDSVVPHPTVSELIPTMMQGLSRDH